jgi:hypothetical protein
MLTTFRSSLLKKFLPAVFDVFRESVPARSLKEQFSRSSEPCKEQSDPIFRFWAEGDSRGFPLFSLSASRYFGNKETLCLYWPLGTVVITGPKVLDFYAAFLFQPGNVFQSGWKRHRRPEPNTQWQFERGAQRAYRLS